MSPRTRSILIGEALEALRGPAVAIDKVEAKHSGMPGLYAFYASATTWKDLSLGKPPDRRPLYVGKAEGTLASRDIQGHFGMRKRGVQSPTGSSTLRRSLAALLAPERGYRGIPRSSVTPGPFTNFGLSVEHDTDLSRWMRGRLRLALWPDDGVAELDKIETAVLGELVPPLNLEKVKTPWRKQVKDARKILAAEAQTWRA